MEEKKEEEKKAPDEPPIQVLKEPLPPEQQRHAAQLGVANLLALRQLLGPIQPQPQGPQPMDISMVQQNVVPFQAIQQGAPQGMVGMAQEGPRSNAPPEFQQLGQSQSQAIQQYQQQQQSGLQGIETFRKMQAPRRLSGINPNVSFAISPQRPKAPHLQGPPPKLLSAQQIIAQQSGASGVFKKFIAPQLSQKLKKQKQKVNVLPTIPSGAPLPSGTFPKNLAPPPPPPLPSSLVPLSSAPSSAPSSPVMSSTIPSSSVSSSSPIPSIGILSGSPSLAVHTGTTPPPPSSLSISSSLVPAPIPSSSVSSSSSSMLPPPPPPIVSAKTGKVQKIPLTPQQKAAVILANKKKDLAQAMKPKVNMLPSMNYIRMNQMVSQNAMPIQDIIDQGNRAMPRSDDFTENQLRDLEKDRIQAFDARWGYVEQIARNSGISADTLAFVLTPELIDGWGDESYRKSLYQELFADLGRADKYSFQDMVDNEGFENNFEEKGDWSNNENGLLNALTNVVRSLDAHGKLTHINTSYEVPLAIGKVNPLERENPANTQFWRENNIKNFARTYMPEKLWESMLQKDQNYFNDNKIAATPEIIRAEYNRIRSARLSRENNIINDNEYMGAVQDSLTRFDGIHGDKSLSQTYMDTWRISEAENKKKIARENFRLKENLKRIDAHLRHMKASPARTFLVDRFQDIIKLIDNGGITPEEAFERTNTLRYIARKAVKEGVPERLTMQDNDQTENVAPFQRDTNIEDPRVYKAWREDNNQFAFPYVAFEHTARMPKVPGTRNVYYFAKPVKRELIDELKELEKNVPEIVDPLNRIPLGQESTVLRKVVNELQGLKLLSSLRFRGVNTPSGIIGYDYMAGLDDLRTLERRILMDEKNINGIRDITKELIMLSDFFKGAYEQLERTKHIGRMRNPKHRLLKNKMQTHPIGDDDWENVKGFDWDFANQAFQRRPYPQIVPSTRPDVENERKAFEEKVRQKDLAEEHKPKDSGPKYTFDNVRWGAKVTAEYPESLKTEYNDGSIEYHVKTMEDLLRMKSEITRMDGTLYVIDLRTGRLFHIDLRELYPGAVYIFKRNVKGRTGAAFAHGVVRDAIRRSHEKLFPYAELRGGNDKMSNLVHRLIAKKDSYDYRHQVRAETGAGFWNYVKKKITNVGKDLIDDTRNGAKQVVKTIGSEYKNFKAQEVNNARNIYQSSSNLVRHPSWQSFSKASTGIGRLSLQPIVTAARTYAGVSDAANKIPGINLLKYDAAFGLPPLALVDGLAHAVKSSGIGSNDPVQYLKMMTDLGDAAIGSGKLSGSVENAARVLNTTAKLADAVVN